MLFFSLHLIKCRKALENHPTSPYYHKINEYKICRWNNKHHVHKAEIAQHEKECSNNLNALKIRQFEKHEEEIKAQITKNITPINSKLPCKCGFFLFHEFFVQCTFLKLIFISRIFEKLKIFWKKQNNLFTSIGFPQLFSLLYRRVFVRVVRFHSYRVDI